MPRDPAAGGTWIAANDRGLVFALLNAYPSPASPEDGAVSWTSRGSVIPQLASSETVSEALDRAGRIDLPRLRPFRLMLLDPRQLIECWPEGTRLRHRKVFLHGPLVRTSSSLGDSVVQAPRRALFRRFFDGTPHPLAAQDAFHDHQWPGAEAISIRMERADARTVSRTVVEVGRDTVRCSYSALSAGNGAPLRLSIALTSSPQQAPRRS
jgi:hypothetical protein